MVLPNMIIMSKVGDALWRMNDSTKKVLRLDFSDFSSSLDAEELSGKGEVESEGEGENERKEDPKEEKGKEKTKEPRPYTLRQGIGLILGPALFLILLLIPDLGGMPRPAQSTLAVTALMATWWMCESIPIPATALLPLILFPMLYIVGPKEAGLGYADRNVFLFMGGFMIAEAMMRWNLHTRIALTIVHAIGRSPRTIILGFMVASAFLSMWISNTATAMMMMVIGLAVVMYFTDMGKKVGVQGINFEPGEFAFGTALMLGIAYACSVGGIGTPVGTPPNLFFKGLVEELGGPEISFVQWMGFAQPFVWIFVIIMWIWLAFIAYPIKLKEVPGGTDIVGKQLKDLGKMSRGEKVTLAVFITTAFLWVFKGLVTGFHLDPFPGFYHFWKSIHECTIAILMAFILFLIPINLKKGEFALNWEWAAKIPWGILLLFGGGIALAKGWMDSGLAIWVGEQLAGMKGIPLIFIVLIIITLMDFLTEFTSNTATTTMMMPVLFSLGIALGVHPFLLMIPAVIAVSCAFMLPVATPPNAIVFGSGYLRIPQMVRAGIFLDFMAIPLNFIIVYFIATFIMSIPWGAGVPPWAL